MARPCSKCKRVKDIRALDEIFDSAMKAMEAGLYTYSIKKQT